MTGLLFTVIIKILQFNIQQCKIHNIRHSNITVSKEAEKMTQNEELNQPIETRNERDNEISRLGLYKQHCKAYNYDQSMYKRSEG